MSKEGRTWMGATALTCGEHPLAPQEAEQRAQGTLSPAPAQALCLDTAPRGWVQSREPLPRQQPRTPAWTGASAR